LFQTNGLTHIQQRAVSNQHSAFSQWNILVLDGAMVSFDSITAEASDPH